MHDIKQMKEQERAALKKNSKRMELNGEDAVDFKTTQKKKKKTLFVI